MAKAYNFQLSDGEVINFLKDVEATGIHREELDLKALHDEKPNVYGDQGSQNVVLSRRSGAITGKRIPRRG